MLTHEVHTRDLAGNRVHLFETHSRDVAGVAVSTRTVLAERAGVRQPARFEDIVPVARYQDVHNRLLTQADRDEFRAREVFCSL